KAIVLVRGKFDGAKLEALAEKEGKDQLKVHKVGTAKVFEAKVPVPQIGEQAAFFGVIDGNTLALGGSKEGIGDALERKAGTKKAKVKKEMLDLIAKADHKLSVSVAILGTVAGQAEVSDRVNNITGGISLVDDIKLDFVIAAKNADTAKELENIIKEGLGQAKQIISFMAANQPQIAPAADLLGAIKVAS